MSATGLTCVAVYTRTIAASLALVWENVLDWEHLPWLHRTTFCDITLLEACSDGWRARVGLAPVERRRESLIEVTLRRDENRYLTSTVEGAGRGTEIWTSLTPLDDGRTGIEVRFCVPDLDPGRADAVGEGYRRLYARLWDEDEAMMVRRAALGGAGTAADGSGSRRVSLGRLGTLRARLPLVTELGGRRVRVLELDGELVAHDTTCPHLAGPLDAAAVVDGRVQCPWHGYRFDVRSGRCVDRPGLRLFPPPRVCVDAATTHVTLIADT